MLPIINMVFVSHDAVHALNANIDTLVLRLLDETTAFHLTIKVVVLSRSGKQILTFESSVYSIKSDLF